MAGHTMHSSTCEQCGIVFERSVKGRRFCSKPCASKTQHLRRSAAGIGPVRKKTGEYVACETCGASVYRKVWQQELGTGRFCNQRCYAAWQGRNQVTTPCEWCGAPMVMSPFRASVQRFCSWECQVEGRSKTAIDRWHNGRRVRKNSDGYLMVFQPDHPSAYADGWMPEHRFVAEQSLGRRIRSDEHVHHINSVKDDNRPENLAVLSPSEHRVITNQDYNARLKADLAALEAYRRRYGPLDVEE